MKEQKDFIFDMENSLPYQSQNGAIFAINEVRRLLRQMECAAKIDKLLGEPAPKIFI